MHAPANCQVDLCAQPCHCPAYSHHFPPPTPPLSYHLQQEIANRERTLLEIFVDDILDYKQDEDFVSNMKRNTIRYVRLFEKAVDALLPEATERIEEDIFDILQQQVQERVAQFEQAGGEPVPVDKLSIPNDLLRRFQVSIIPPVADKPKKLREIRALEVGHLV